MDDLIRASALLINEEDEEVPSKDIGEDIDEEDELGVDGVDMEVDSWQ